MANVPPNKSEEALEAFIAAVSQSHLPTNHAFQIRRLMEAATQDELVSNIGMGGPVRTGWDEDRRRTWEEFCLSYEMDGDRFKYAVEALMDLKIPGTSPPPLFWFR